jgi:hypothetical protein
MNNKIDAIKDESFRQSPSKQAPSPAESPIKQRTPEPPKKKEPEIVIASNDDVDEYDEDFASSFNKSITSQ